MTAVTAATLSFPQAAVSRIDGEYRVRDLALAEALGFADVHKIRSLIKRHIKALQAFGGISATVARNLKNKDNSGRGRPGRAYHLNEHQAVFICIKSETTNATALTIGIVETFMAMQRGTNETALPKPRTLTAVQRRDIQKTIREKWPDQDRRVLAYDRLKERFDVARYRDISRARFEAAMAFIGDLDVPRAPRTGIVRQPMDKRFRALDTCVRDRRCDDLPEPLRDFMTIVAHDLCALTHSVGRMRLSGLLDSEAAPAPPSACVSHVRRRPSSFAAPVIDHTLEHSHV